MNEMGFEESGNGLGYSTDPEEGYDGASWELPGEDPTDMHSSIDGEPVGPIGGDPFACIKDQS